MNARQVHEMNIILAVDGSEHSSAAARLLKDLPLPYGSRINVLAVLVPRNASDHANLEQALADSKATLSGVKANVKTELLTGYPAEQISEYAAKNVPDLIVLGAVEQRCQHLELSYCVFGIAPCQCQTGLEVIDLVGGEGKVHGDSPGRGGATDRRICRRPGARRASSL